MCKTFSTPHGVVVTVQETVTAIAIIIVVIIIETTHYHSGKKR